MRYAIDVLFSDWLYMTILMLVVMFTCVGFAFKNPFKNNNLNRIYKVALYVFAFTFMLSFSFLYFGLSDGFKRIYVGKNIIVLQEEYERGGEGPTEYVTRMHILNKKDGIEIDRKYIGAYGKVVGVKGDSIAFIEDKNLIVINGMNGNRLYEIHEENWSEINPEMAAGINRIDDNQNRDERVQPFIEIDCKNGKHYWIDPFTKKLFTTEPDNIYLRQFSKRKYDLYYRKSLNGYRYYLKTQATPNSQLYYILPTGNGEKFFHKPDSTTYIQPFLMCMDSVNKFFVFGHYTNTDLNDFYIEARDFNFQPLWKYTTEELETHDRYNQYSCEVWYYENGILYFNSGGFLIAMNPKNNKIIWKTRH